VTADDPLPGGEPGPPAEGAPPLLLHGGRDGEGAPLDLLLAGGRVVDAGTSAGAHPWAGRADRLDCGGRVILPAAAEPHAHLDKALLAPRVPNRTGDLLGAIGAMRAAAVSITDDDVLARARRAARTALAHGFTAIRSHVDVGGPVRGRPVAALAGLRDELRGSLDLQLAALVHDPITGLAGRTRRRELLDALDQGADVIGGAPWLDSDPIGAVDELTAVAADSGRPIDLHLDETTDVAVVLVQRYVERVERLGLGGRATASHCVSLGQLPVERALALARRLAAAGVAVVALPQTNLLLQGRDALTTCVRGLAPLRLLEQAGVTVAAGGDNWQDPFNPLGRIDPLETAGLVVTAAHLAPALAYELVSGRARAAMGLAPAGTRPGERADLIAIRAGDVRDALATATQDRVVIRAGRIVARTRVITDVALS
jgi:cytosine deaminase